MRRKAKQTAEVRSVARTLDAKTALALVRARGVVLAAGKGTAPSLAEEIVGAPIRGSWWAHPKSHQIFAVLEELADSPEILMCRLVDGKITLVHRRLWAALVKVAHDFPRKRLARVHQEHTRSGQHRNRETEFPEWVPHEIGEAADRLSATVARSMLAAAIASAPARVRVKDEHNARRSGVGAAKGRGLAAQARRRSTA